MNTDLVQEVAAPGSVFWETITHPENVEILEGDEKTRRLPPDKLKVAEKKLLLLKDALNIYFEAYIRHLQHKIAKINTNLPRLLKRDPERATAAEESIEAIKTRIALIRAERIYPVKPQRGNTYKIRTAGHASEALTTVHRLQARVDEHYRAIDNDNLNKRLQDEMEQEIGFYANQCIDRWSALGYREEWYVEGKRNLRKVQFEECHFTEDNLQFKIYVTSLTLLDHTDHHLPDKVKAWDLVKEETLRELEAACECPVTSPHVDESQGFEKGAWIVVHRVGMRDGLFNYIELNKVLPKYNQALRPRFALPVGIKAGRKIEYLYLDTTPHIMVNGITGSGKTNAMRTFLAYLSQFYTPDEIRFLLVDLKRSGDLNKFRNVPHMLRDIVKDIDTLAEAMPQLVALMQERMAQLSAADCVDIIEYNSKAAPENRMARIWVMVDECGAIRDLSQSGQSEVIFRCLTLLAAQARAAGIHLALGTQQASKEAIPSRITNNITYTLSARQRTTSGAMGALGNNKLKSLPAIKGRMLVDTGFGLIPVQTPYATPEDIDSAVAIAKDYPAPRPLVLPGEAEAVIAALEAAEAALPQPVTREQIIAFALQNNGSPNAQKIYEQCQGATPRERIKEMIRQLGAEGEVIHDGITYTIKPQGKGYKLVAASENQKTVKPPAKVSIVSSENADEAVLDETAEAVFA